MVNTMANTEGVRNYSHCPLKKRPLSFVSEDVIDDDQPQDLSMKRRRVDDENDTRAQTPPNTTTSEPPTSAHISPVPAYAQFAHRPQLHVPLPCSPSRVPTLADFYLQLFESSSAAPQTQPQPPTGMWWRPPAVWPVMHSPPTQPQATGQHHHNPHHHARATHPLLAARLASSPQPSDDRLASPGSTASEDSGVGTETLSEDEIDVIGDSESPRRLSVSYEGAHEAAYHNNAARGEARYSCTECRKSYSTYAGLSKHKQFHCASLGNKSFACKHCEKVYTSLGALKMHIRTHTLPCKCPLCGKAFSRPWLLQGHIRTHTGEKPFQCPQCDRCFADRSNLRAHLQTHADIKKYACNTCHKTFSRMSLLNKHTEAACPARMQSQQQAAPPKQQEGQGQLQQIYPEVPSQS